MTDDEPNLITLGYSQRFVVHVYTFSIGLYQLDADRTWMLEVVEHREQIERGPIRQRSSSRASWRAALPLPMICEVASQDAVEHIPAVPVAGTHFPWGWASTLRSMGRGEVLAWRTDHGVPMIELIWVSRDAYNLCSRMARERHLPDLEILGYVTSRLLRLNSVVAWDAVKAGLLDGGPSGIRLPSLQAFRRNYVTLAEGSVSV